jgi:hypothetical protein
MSSPASYVTVHVTVNSRPLTYNANVALRKKVLKQEKMDIRTFGTSQEALHLCLDRIKKAKDENELRRLTEDLQRIVFHQQCRNAARAR